VSDNASRSTDSKSEDRRKVNFLRTELFRVLVVSVITFGMLFGLYFMEY